MNLVLIIYVIIWPFVKKTWCKDPSFCIVDEVDSILIDEARTPLIISGPSEKSAKIYSTGKLFPIKERSRLYSR